MSVASAAVHSLENNLPKVIDARTHGLIDYAHATFFLGMALVCRKKSPRAALAALITGSFVLAESLLTDYPMGAVRTVPFETHGRLDAGFAGISLLIPSVFQFKSQAAANIFKANAFVEATVVGLTDFNSERARSGEPPPGFGSDLEENGSSTSSSTHAA